MAHLLTDLDIGLSASSDSLPEPVLAFLRRAGLARPDETPPAAVLTGGVSSDIWKVELAGGAVCVKRALPNEDVRGRSRSQPFSLCREANGYLP
jgi:hypothetical protein